MSTSQQRRQEIYNKIKETSKQEFILAEMRKLGFWPNDQEFPSASAQLIEKEGELTRELRELTAKQKKFKDKEKALQEIHRKRMLASREKQRENKERRKREREDKARKWSEQQANEISYLGEEVSSGLGKKQSKNERLNELELPVFSSEKDLAAQMGISINQLRFLSYHRKISTVHHYKQFYMPKKSGGKRLISAPMPLLKNVQSWLLENILYKIEVDDVANGFVPNKSILTNAKPHVGKDLVINIDLKDFFPSINYRRVKRFWRKIVASRFSSQPCDI